MGGNGGHCVQLTTLPPSCAECIEIWESQLPGTLWACPGLCRDCFTCLHYSLYANYVTVDLHIGNMTLKNSMQYTKEEERRVDLFR